MKRTHVVASAFVAVVVIAGCFEAGPVDSGGQGSTGSTTANSGAAGSSGTSAGASSGSSTGASGATGAASGKSGSSSGATTGSSGSTTGAATGATGATSGGTGSTTGAATGSSGSSGAGGADAGAASCLDDIRDGDETGVDCGGSCPPCVAYSVGTPNSDGNVKNACTDSGDVSFICPRFMLFSSEMKQAAADDASANGWPAGSFNYGVATLDGANCCECYQIVYSALQNGQTSAPPPKPLIVQNFNQGGAPNAFDVFMGKGGEGAQTSGCAQLYTTYPSTGEPNGGGITASSISACTGAGVSSQACVSAVTSACDQIQASSSYVTTTTQNSCIESNSAASLYHENWNVKAQKVECPLHLTQVTGCRLNAEGLPNPDPTVQTAAQASSWGSFGTTTMEDCCKPSCAWPGNVSNTQSGWATMYQCQVDGTPMTN